MEGEARKLLASSSAGSEFLHFLAGIWSWVAHKFDQLLPPETRSETLHHWAHVGLTIVLPVSLVLLCLYLCCRCRPCACLSRCFSCRCRCRPFRPCACLRRCFSCFFCCRCWELDPLEFEALLMKAPGRGGAMMPRGVFEGNPRGYFRDLRANKDLPKYW